LLGVSFGRGVNAYGHLLSSDLRVDFFLIAAALPGVTTAGGAGAIVGILAQPLSGLLQVLKQTYTQALQRLRIVQP